MAWTFNDPFVLPLPGILPVEPVFDGKHVWAVSGSGIFAIEYWGPFLDEVIYPNDSYTRWQENEIDELTGNNVGPKLVGAKTIPLTDTVNHMIYNDGFIYIATPTKFMKANVTTGEVTTISELGVRTRNSNIAISGDRIYFTNAAPVTQTVDDQQQLWSVSISTGLFTNHGFLPGKKQLDARDLVIANDILYVSCMNTRELLKYNATTGGFLTSLVVNRDIEKLYRVNNDVFVISSMRGKTTIGAAEFATSMVSQVTPSDTVNHLYGILTAGRHLADAGDYVWFITDDGFLQRTKKSANETFVTDTVAGLTKELNSAYVIEKASNGWENGAKNPSIQTWGIKSIFTTPVVSYEYWNGSSLVPVTIPQYLFLITDSNVIAVRLTSPLKWVNSMKLNQYTALSTGGLGYKQG